MFTFLGTAASEQGPGMWCTCGNCQKARREKGRNIRRNSAAALGPHTLIDFGPSIPSQLDAHGLSLIDVETLLITHGHEDHFLPWYLRWRYFSRESKMGPTLEKPRPLTLYGSKKVRELTLAAIKDDPQGHHLEIVVWEPWKTIKTKYLSATPLIANHDPRQDCFNFILGFKGKTILYAVDTAWFLPETKEFLKAYCFDLVVMEGTFGFYNDYDDTQPGHSNFYTNKRAREWMLRENLIQEATPFVITHIGPHHTPIYDEASPLLQKWGLTLAYDGLRFKLSNL